MGTLEYRVTFLHALSDNSDDMMRHLTAFLFGLTLIAGAVATPLGVAFAAEEEASSGAASNKTLAFSNLVVPVERDGKLVNYLFVSSIVTINDGFDHWEIREKAHVFRDLILKEVHRETVGLQGHPMDLDEEKFKAAVINVFDREVGIGCVRSIEIQASDSLKLFLEG